jgi:hypothetical protein
MSEKDVKSNIYCRQGWWVDIADHSLRKLNGNVRRILDRAAHFLHVSFVKLSTNVGYICPNLVVIKSQVGHYNRFCEFDKKYSCK